MKKMDNLKNIDPSKTKIDKRLIIGLLVVVALAVGVWLGMTLRVENTLKLFPAEKTTVKEKEVGYGWSVKDNASDAVKEAVAMMKDKLGGADPDYVLTWYTIGYDPSVVGSTLRSLLNTPTQIQGNSSAVAVMTPDGYHLGKVGSIAVLGVSSAKVHIGVGSADLDKLTPREAGKQAIQAAMSNAHQTVKPQMVYIMTVPGKEEETLKGIEDIIGREVPIIGGSSGDETLSGKWSQIGNDEVLKNGVILSAVYTDLKIGKEYEFGYERSLNHGIATKAEGRTLYEIDGKPAAEVYNDWTDEQFSEELKKGGSILAKATFYPLAKLVKGEEVSYLCVSHPGIINLPEKSITMFANIDKGDEVVLLHGNWEWLVNRAQSTARKAMLSENIAPGEGLFAFYTFCAGTLLAIPESERPKIPVLLKEELGDIPFVSGFTLGEQTFMPGVGNQHTNLVNSIAIIK